VTLAQKGEAPRTEIINKIVNDNSESLDKLSAAENRVNIKTAPCINQGAVFILRKGYFQPNAWLKIQSEAAMEIKNKPRPTGLPQLNHDPHARQCFKLFSWL
jgi:hypothetical protein